MPLSRATCRSPRNRWPGELRKRDRNDRLWGESGRKLFLLPHPTERSVWSFHRKVRNPDSLRQARCNRSRSSGDTSRCTVCRDSGSKTPRRDPGWGGRGGKWANDDAGRQDPRAKAAVARCTRCQDAGERFAEPSTIGNFVPTLRLAEPPSIPARFPKGWPGSAGTASPDRRRSKHRGVTCDDRDDDRPFSLPRWRR
jgi:hypothetical protein